MIRSFNIVTAIFALLFAISAHAGGAKYGALTFSDNHENDDPKSTFATDTPKIFLNAELIDFDGGEKVSGAWIAEKTDAAPPNYKIDSVDLTVGDSMNVATFSLSKPNAGWPVGDYRVDLTINGKPAGVARFKIAK